VTNPFAATSASAPYYPFPTHAFAADPWTPAQRFGFRIAVLYFAVFAVGSLLDGTDTTRRLLAAVITWTAHAIVRAPASAPISDGTNTVAILFAALFTATGLAAMWSALARRAEYRRPRVVPCAHGSPDG
jgi:hypothetical protein